jgi:hypothetical protein
MGTPNEQEILKFLRENGTFGKRLTQVLEKIAPEVKDVISAGGWNILKDDLARWQEIAVKVLTNDASENERQECYYLTKIRIPSIIDKLIVWYKGIGLITK